VNQNGQPIQLRGMSSLGLQWEDAAPWMNINSIRWLRDDWNTNVVRAAMYTEEDGYITNPSVANKVWEIVDAADHVNRVSLLLKQKLAEIKDRFPSVIAEVRGEGLLVGLRAVVPSGDLVDALRDEKVLAVAAGDNVVRLLPPLIVSEAEIAEGVRRLEKACTRLAVARKSAQGAAG
jgi:4-aminobutyrate aminotransferase-like enzyme